MLPADAHGRSRALHGVDSGVERSHGFRSNPGAHLQRKLQPSKASHSRVSAHEHEEVLEFWFPQHMGEDHATIARQFEWWFRGGADVAIVERFTPLLEQAKDGALDDWAGGARSRLALIIVLDQFSRSIYRGTREAYAQDPKAIGSHLRALRSGTTRRSRHLGRKPSASCPSGTLSSLPTWTLAVKLAEELAEQTPQNIRKFMEHSASQARGHREVIARFGRQPHRNAILGRQSTPEETKYLAAGQFVHQRSLPP